MYKIPAFFGAVGLLLLASVALPSQAKAQNFYAVAEAGFAAIEADISAVDAVRDYLDNENPVDDDGFRATLGVGYRTFVPVLGVYAAVEASAARSFIESDKAVEYAGTEFKTITTNINGGTADKFVRDYKISEEWRFAVSADVGLRLLPGLIVFARLSSVETDADIEAAARQALDGSDEVIDDCTDTCLDAIETAITNNDSDDEAAPDEDDLSGREIGIGLLYDVPFTPLSVRGIITVDPETAFSAAIMWSF